MTKLNITRPIVFFDLETTGINIASDRIVEISLLKIMPDGSRLSRTYRVNPTIPIPAEVTAIHGISDDDVKNELPFRDIAAAVAAYISDSDLGGYNCGHFDIPLLAEEFLRAGVDIDLKTKKVIDAQVIFHKMEQRTLAAAYKFYCNKDMENAHSAEADIAATYEVLLAQIERYDNITNDINFLHEFTNRSNSADFAGRIGYNEHKVEVFNFGKHKGRSVEEVFQKEPSYYDWMMQGDFPLYTKKLITSIRLRRLSGKA